MSQFEVDDEKIKHISDVFKIKEDAIKIVHDEYVRICKNMKSHYLAHIIRSLETYVRKVKKAPFFIITCEPKAELKDFEVGRAGYKEGQYFAIVYPPSMDEKQLRVCIAHELGHLFLLVSANKSKDEIIEPLSSIFGVFTIFDKNDFYADKTAPFKHRSWQDVVSDFSLLQNKGQGRLNISETK